MFKFVFNFYPNEMNLGVDNVENTVRLCAEFLREKLQQPSSPASPQPNVQARTQPKAQKHSQSGIGASKTTKEGSPKKPFFYVGKPRTALAQALYDGKAYDKEHALSTKRLVMSGKKYTTSELSPNPDSSSPAFSQAGWKAIQDMEGEGLLMECENGFYLTEKGREEFHAKLMKCKDISGKSQAKLTEMFSAADRPDEYLDQDDGSNVEHEIEEEGRRRKEEEIREKSYVLALCFLEQRSGSASLRGFSRQELLTGLRIVQEIFNVAFPRDDDELLQQNVRDGLVERAINGYRVSTMGERAAEEIFTKYLP